MSPKYLNKNPFKLLLKISYQSRTSLIRTNREFQKSCPDLVFRLIDNPDFLRQNVKAYLSGLGAFIKK